MNKLLLSFLVLYCSLSVHGQMLHYEVVKGSKKLGDMTVEQTLSPDGVYYEIKSHVVFKLLFSFVIDYTSTSEYKHGQLIKEYTHNELNGKTQKKSTIWYDGDKYTLDLDGSRIFFQEKIEYSVAAVYFREPTDGQRVFSPQFGQYITFKKTGDHTYEIDSPDGTNVYTYINGICKEVVVERDFAKFSFVMTPATLLAVKNKTLDKRN